MVLLNSNLLWVNVHRRCSIHDGGVIRKRFLCYWSSVKRINQSLVHPFTNAQLSGTIDAGFVRIIYHSLLNIQQSCCWLRCCYIFKPKMIIVFQWLQKGSLCWPRHQHLKHCIPWLQHTGHPLNSSLRCQLMNHFNVIIFRHRSFESWEYDPGQSQREYWASSEGDPGPVWKRIMGEPRRGFCDSSHALMSDDVSLFC